MNQRREIVIALPVSAMKQALSKLERLLVRQIYRLPEKISEGPDRVRAFFCHLAKLFASPVVPPR
jgi:hypothetical protein